MHWKTYCLKLKGRTCWLPLMKGCKKPRTNIKSTVNEKHIHWETLQHRRLCIAKTPGMTTIAITTSNKTKLPPKYFVPFRIIERKYSIAYRLELPPSSRIHNVFLSMYKSTQAIPWTMAKQLPPVPITQKDMHYHNQKKRYYGFDYIEAPSDY